MSPGATAFTRTSGPTALASSAVRWLSAAFDAAYGMEEPVGRSPAIDETLTMLPWRRRSAGIAATESCHVTKDVDVEDLAPDVDTRRVEFAMGDDLRGARVVHENVQLTAALEHRGDQAFAVVSVRDVCLDVVRARCHAREVLTRLDALPRS